MGFFGTYLFDGDRWHDRDPDAGPPSTPEPWLLVDIQDSDIATLTYGPAGPGSGVAYLGDTPRTYWEREDASAPTDVHREAAGLASWRARLPLPGAVPTAADLAGYLAADVDPADVDLDEELDVDAMDDADVFVEIKTARLLLALGLPLPPGLPG